MEKTLEDKLKDSKEDYTFDKLMMNLVMIYLC